MYAILLLEVLLIGLPLLILLLLHLALEDLLALEPGPGLGLLDLPEAPLLLVALLEELDLEVGLLDECVDGPDLLFGDLLAAFFVEVGQLDLLPQLLDLFVLRDQLLRLTLPRLFLQLPPLQLPRQLAFALLEVEAHAVLLAGLLVEVGARHNVTECINGY